MTDLRRDEGLIKRPKIVIRWYPAGRGLGQPYQEYKVHVDEMEMTPNEVTVIKTSVLPEFVKPPPEKKAKPGRPLDKQFTDSVNEEPWLSMRAYSDWLREEKQGGEDSALSFGLAWLANFRKYPAARETYRGSRVLTWFWKRQYADDSMLAFCGRPDCIPVEVWMVKGVSFDDAQKRKQAAHFACPWDAFHAAAHAVGTVIGGLK